MLFLLISLLLLLVLLILCDLYSNIGITLTRYTRGLLSRRTGQLVCMSTATTTLTLALNYHGLKTSLPVPGGRVDLDVTFVDYINSAAAADRT